MDRLLSGRAGATYLRLYDEDGVALDPTGQTATVAVRDADGALVSSGSATRVSAGYYKYAVAKTVLANLGQYDVTWTYTISGVSSTSETMFESVGSYVFELPELRAFDPSLSDTVKYTAEMLRQARTSAEERLEEAAGVSFTRRAKQVTLSSLDRDRLILPDCEVTDILSVMVDEDADGNFVALDEDQFDAIEISPDGVLKKVDYINWVEGTNNYLVEYEYGFKTVPTPVKRAALMLAFEALVPSALPARATSQSTDLGEFRVSIANVDAGRYTGIPDVDAVIAQFGRRKPAVG